jgi:hypothetical protein
MAPKWNCMSLSLGPLFFFPFPSSLLGPVTFFSFFPLPQDGPRDKDPGSDIDGAPCLVGGGEAMVANGGALSGSALQRSDAYM